MINVASKLAKDISYKLLKEGIKEISIFLNPNIPIAQI